MKILLLSHAFYPHVGGLETVARVLAEEFIARGHEVRLVTQSPVDVAGRRADGPEAPRFTFPVYRRPGARRLFDLTKWCDVFFQNNISLQTLWPLLFVHRPWIVAHQTWLTRVDGRTGWQDRLKMYLIRFGSPIAISRAVAAPLPVRAEIIGNPYQAELFGLRPEIARDRSLVFLGRLVSDKGADLLMEALVLLKVEYSLCPGLTIVGNGPELPALRIMARNLGVESQVVFAGQQTGEELVRTLNRHQIMVVPSRLAEPFGVVALEGAACGCTVVGSAQGGLADAIGPAGLTFENNDVRGLASALHRVLTDRELRTQLREQAGAHLERFSPRRIADEYLKVFQREIRKISG